MSSTEEPSLYANVALFAAVLPLRLREAGVPLHPDDASAIGTILEKQPRWRVDELADALSPVLVRRPNDSAIIREAISALATEFVANTNPTRETGPGGGPVEPPKTFCHQLRCIGLKIGAGFTVSVELAVSVLRVVGRVAHYAGRGLPFLAAGGLPLLAFGVLSAFLSGVSPPNDDGECLTCPTVSATDWNLVIDALIAGLSTGGLILLFWRAVIMELEVGRSRGELSTRTDTFRADGHSAPATPMRILPIGDQTYFKASEIGGKPERFLRKEQAGKIAELYNYRPGEVDPLRIDIRGTLDRYARGGDPASYVAQRRRELPLVLILVDRCSEGWLWNTLAGDLVDSLKARGIFHEQIVFPGSLFVNSGSKLTIRPEGVRLRRIMTEPGWTMALVFGEAHRLGPIDLKLLGDVAENGALAFLDMRDSALWDRRHVMVERSGVMLSEATERGLADVLARLFAPDQRRLSHTRPVVAPRRFHPRGDAWTVALQRLGDERGEGYHWASDCALIEPVSFALAELLRDRYASLRTPAASLAFSRLSTLPGAWMGPDGLRFEARVRRRLLNAFAARPWSERKETAKIIRDAIRIAKPSTGGTTATAVHAWVEARAEAYFDSPDGALEAAMRLENEGLVATAPVRDFLDRVARGENSRTDGTGLSGDPDVICLKHPPSRLLIRRQLAKRLSRPSDGEPRQYADGADLPLWRLEAPNGRLRSSKLREDLNGAFLAGARHLLLAGREGVELCDMVLMRTEPLFLGDDLGRVREVLTASRAKVAILIGESGRAVRVDVEPGKVSAASAERSLLLPPFLESSNSVSGRVSADGALAIFAPRDANALYVVAMDDSRNADMRSVGVDFRHNGVLAIDGERLALGMSDGSVRGLNLRSIGDRKGRIASFAWPNLGGDPLYLSLTPDPRAYRDRDARLIVAVCAEGRIVIADQYQILAEIRCGWDVKRIAPLPDAQFGDRFRGTDVETGERLFLGVLGTDGAFDVLGVPLSLPPGGPVWLMEQGPGTMKGRMRTSVGFSAQTQRVAFYAIDPATGYPFLEVRPLVQVPIEMPLRPARRDAEAMAPASTGAARER
ncbi:hypothetical protein [Sinorhizobium meliloti]|uniref:hypothetical protein n=1 Tax=Rhizobium meliloti TaxID=382 RepID=UPI001297CF6A|nr:hypothetical protein [Sinorhizobium meliloti]MDX0191719.1 hypothetical protein [Sinorhizobium meliloti]MQV09055.1 hypothetical protein [Sinorhizobium meliloti]